MLFFMKSSSSFLVFDEVAVGVIVVGASRFFWSCLTRLSSSIVGVGATVAFVGAELLLLLLAVVVVLRFEDADGVVGMFVGATGEEGCEGGEGGCGVLVLL